jgi:hypothetical protein
MIPDELGEDTIGDRFLRLLHEDDGPDDRPDPPAAGVAARIVVVRATSAAYPEQGGYSVHVARVELVDGVEEVVGGVATPAATSARLSVAERSAHLLAADPEAHPRRYRREWNVLVVNDGNGTECYRRPIPAAA